MFSPENDHMFFAKEVRSTAGRTILKFLHGNVRPTPFHLVAVLTRLFRKNILEILSAEMYRIMSRVPLETLKFLKFPIHSQRFLLFNAFVKNALRALTSELGRFLDHV